MSGFLATAPTSRSASIYYNPATSSTSTLSLHDALPIYSNFSQPQSHLSFCVLLQYLVERRRVVTQILKQNAKREDRKSGSAGMQRPNSYPVVCLQKKDGPRRLPRVQPARHHVRLPGDDG